MGKRLNVQTSNRPKRSFGIQHSALGARRMAWREQWSAERRSGLDVWTCRRVGDSRRGFVLIAVLVVVGSALLIGTSIIFIAQSEVAGARSTGDAVQSRELAQSGLHIITHRLNQQRETILRGEQPTLNQQYTVYELGNRRGVVRLLPIGPDDARLMPESAKLDINEADEEMLAAIALLDDSQVEQIVENAARFQSVFELLTMEGITAVQMYGPLDEVRWMSDAQREIDANDFVRRDVDAAPPDALADVLTVYAIEPPLQRDGRRRINLNVEWSDELGERLDERFGQGAGAFVRQIIAGGAVFDRDARIVQLLRQGGAPAEDWVDILDAVTTHAGEYHFGRVNINSATAAVLEALPGITSDQAASIVRMREGLGSEERETIVWPVMNGIVSEETFEGIVDHITTRSWTYRVRIAAGEVDVDDPEGRLEQPLILEAVIDLAAPAPRIAYLRDVSMVQMAATMRDEEQMRADAEDWRSRDDDARFARSDDSFDDDDAANGPEWREDVWATMMADPPNEDEDDEDWRRGVFEADEDVGDPFERGFFDDDDDEDDEGANGAAGSEQASPQRRRIGRWRGG